MALNCGVSLLFRQKSTFLICTDTLYRLNIYFKYFNNFPFVNISGAFLNYPILFLPIVMLADEKFRKKLVENKIMLFYIVLLLLPLLVTVVDSLWTPWLTERYRMDIYYQQHRLYM